MSRNGALGLAAGLIGAGYAWSLLAPGPLPGDVAVTQGLQRLLGSAPGWATSVTDLARFPTAWATLAGAAALAGALRGWRAAAAAGVAFAAAHAVDKALRWVAYAPRPTADLVAVASPASSSGLPSTFGLVFGALFGLVLLAAADRRDARALPIAGLGAALLAAGFLARVTLGGHWPSQMLLSIALGTLVAALALALLGARHRRRPGRSPPAG
jgi:membrane-associated phospholipid phosphatase